MIEFPCEKALLQAVISTTSRAVSPRSSIPALEGILPEAGNDLHLTGYNLETGIRAIVPADIREEGILMLGARLFGEIVHKLPGDIITFQSENYMINIKCDMNEFNVLGTNLEKFPELPTVECQNPLILPQSRLGAIISQTLFAVSDNESRPIHTGSLSEMDDEGLTIVSVGDYRLALRHESIDKKERTETFSFVVPGAALSEVEKICSNVDEPTSVTQGTRHVVFKVGDTMLVSHRLESEFLAYHQTVLRDNTIHVEGDTRTLLSSIGRVSLIISDKLRSPLRHVLDSDLLKISTKTTIDDAYDEYLLSDDGGGLEVGFSNKYLMDAPKAVPADKMRLELTIGMPLCVILPTREEKNSLYMVLPVRLKAGE